MVPFITFRVGHLSKVHKNLINFWGELEEDKVKTERERKMREMGRKREKRCERGIGRERKMR